MRKWKNVFTGLKYVLRMSNMSCRGIEITKLVASRPFWFIKMKFNLVVLCKAVVALKNTNHRNRKINYTERICIVNLCIVKLCTKTLNNNVGSYWSTIIKDFYNHRLMKDKILEINMFRRYMYLHSVVTQ